MVVNVTQPRAGPQAHGDNGHHALWLTRGQECLVTSSTVGARWVHDLAIEKYATLHVYANIHGYDINLDNHRSVGVGWGAGPWEWGHLGCSAHVGTWACRGLWRCSGCCGV